MITTMVQPWDQSELDKCFMKVNVLGLVSITAINIWPWRRGRRKKILPHGILLQRYYIQPFTKSTKICTGEYVYLLKYFFFFNFICCFSLLNSWRTQIPFLSSLYKIFNINCYVCPIIFHTFCAWIMHANVMTIIGQK